jgi:hypothetical protein
MPLFTAEFTTEMHDDGLVAKDKGIKFVSASFL